MWVRGYFVQQSSSFSCFLKALRSCSSLNKTNWITAVSAGLEWVRLPDVNQQRRGYLIMLWLTLWFRGSMIPVVSASFSLWTTASSVVSYT